MASTPQLTPTDYKGIRNWITDDRGPVPEGIVLIVLFRVMEVLNQENNVLLLASPIYICGDIHGQLDDLIWLLHQARAFRDGDRIHDPREIKQYQRPQDPQQYRHPCEFDERKRFLFMGDYVDRGWHSLNTFLYLVCLKLQFPNSIFMLRGNHESRQVSTRYGFYHEIILSYGHSGLWVICNEVFDLLPLAALIDQDVFCVHGGLSPRIPMIEKISLLDRQVELPQSGPLADLCWSDPENVSAWRENTRGAGYLFGPTETTKFTRMNRLTFIARSHQLAMKGFETYFASPEEKRGYRLITIWSAPNYSYKSGNKASIMGLRLPNEKDDKKLIIFEPRPSYARIELPEDERPVATQYFS